MEMFKGPIEIDTANLKSAKSAQVPVFYIQNYKLSKAGVHYIALRFSSINYKYLGLDIHHVNGRDLLYVEILSSLKSSGSHDRSISKGVHYSAFMNHNGLFIEKEI